MRLGLKERRRFRNGGEGSGCIWRGVERRFWIVDSVSVVDIWLTLNWGFAF